MIAFGMSTPTSAIGRKARNSQLGMSSQPQTHILSRFHEGSTVPFTGSQFTAPPLGYYTYNVMANENAACCDLSCSSGSYLYIIGFRTGLCYTDSATSKSSMYGCAGESFISTYHWSSSTNCSGNPTNVTNFNYPECLQTHGLSYGYTCALDSDYKGLVPVPAAMEDNAIFPYVYYFNEDCSGKPFEYYAYQSGHCFESSNISSSLFTCENSVPSVQLYKSETCSGLHYTESYNDTSCTSYSVFYDDDNYQNFTNDDDTYDDAYNWDTPAWFQSVCTLPSGDSGDSSGSSDKSSLSSGSVAGVTIGVVAILSAVCISVWYYKYRSKSNQQLSTNSKSSSLMSIDNPLNANLTSSDNTL